MPCIRVTLLNMTLLNIGVKRIYVYMYIHINMTLLNIGVKRIYVYMYIHINMTLLNIGVKRNGKGQSGG